MFKRRRRDQELTTEDAPDSIAPWEMLPENEIGAVTARVQKRYPSLAAFARRPDTGETACFDKGPDGTARTVIVINQEHTERRSYPNFTAWFDDALADAAR